MSRFDWFIQVTSKSCYYVHLEILVQRIIIINDMTCYIIRSGLRDQSHASIVLCMILSWLGDNGSIETLAIHTINADDYYMGGHHMYFRCSRNLVCKLFSLHGVNGGGSFGIHSIPIACTDILTIRKLGFVLIAGFVYSHALRSLVLWF